MRKWNMSNSDKLKKGVYPPLQAEPPVDGRIPVSAFQKPAQGEDEGKKYAVSEYNTTFEKLPF